MKKYLSKSKVVFLAMAIIVATTLAASAIKLNLKSNNEPAGISFEGVNNELAVYKLALKNKIKGTYFVSITNAKGDVLYCDQAEGANITREYQFDNKKEGHLTFTVTDTKGKTVGEYKIDRSSKTVQPIVH